MRPDPESTTMGGLLALYPGARRALFRHYHIGGCAGCGFQPGETLSGVCARNGGIDPQEAIDRILESHDLDEKISITPAEAAGLKEKNGVRFVDIRTREEFEAVHIPGSQLLSQDFLQEIMAKWDKAAPLVLVDHTGNRSLDAASYFAGHGFTAVRALKGGIDAWSCGIDPSLPRYTTQ